MMSGNQNFAAQIFMTDSSNKLTKDGFLYLCQSYGTVKNIIVHSNKQDSYALIEFEEENSVHRILNDKALFPSCISIDRSNQAIRQLSTLSNEENSTSLDIFEQIEEPSKNNSNKTVEVNTCGESIYFGPDIYYKEILEIATQEKIKEKEKLFSLENDELFGKPMAKKWIAIEDLVFPIHSINFYQRFESCVDGGEIQIEKKLSPSTFTGWISLFNNGENVRESLRKMSYDIEKSNALNINDLELGMLIGVFDHVTNSFTRGYVTFVVGKSANVVLCDYGRAINAVIFRTLPNLYSSLPIYSFKAHTAGDFVSILKKSHKFNVKSVDANRIVLRLFIDDKKIKIQLKNWKPTVEEYGVPYVNIKSGSKVELIRFKDMNSVYIRSKEKSDFNLFFSTWNNLAAYCYENPNTINREPFYGEIIGFKSMFYNNNYTRGRIYKYLGNKFYIVKHMDNPFKEIVNSSDMIELQFKHKIAPLSILKVGLKDAVPYPMEHGYARDFINHIFDHKLTVHFDEDDDGWKSVELYLSVIQENVNAILLGLAQPTWLKPIQDNSMEEIGNFCKHSNLHENELTINSTVYLTFVLYHDGIFYMRDKNFGNSFVAMNNMIKEYCSLNLCPYLPHKDEVCLGKFPDGLWYRVICDEVKPGHLVKVHSLDLGNTAFLNTRNMKKIPEEISYHPTHVYLCLLENIDEISKEQTEILKQHENTDVECTIVKHSDKMYLVKCPFLENILK